MKKQNAVILLLVTIIFWGSAFPAIRLALQDYQAGSIALGRFLVASVIFFFLVFYKGYGLPRLKDYPLILFCGLSGIAVYHFALNYGEITVQAGIASVVISMGPIFILIAARLFLKEKINKLAYFGMFIAFCGVIIVSEIDFVHFQVKDSGVLYVLLAAFSTTGYVIGQKILLKKYKPLQLTAWTIIAGTLFLLPFIFSLEQDFKKASVFSTLSVIYLGVFPSYLAYSLWTMVLNYVDANKAASFLYLSPVVAFLIAWFFLGELPTVNDFIGCVVIFLGVLLVNWRKKKKNIRSFQEGE